MPGGFFDLIQSTPQQRKPILNFFYQKKGVRCVPWTCLQTMRYRSFDLQDVDFCKPPPNRLVPTQSNQPRPYRMWARRGICTYCSGVYRTGSTTQKRSSFKNWELKKTAPLHPVTSVYRVVSCKGIVSLSWPLL